MKKHLVSIIILILFFITIIYPYLAITIYHTLDAKNIIFTLQFGILHIPSFVFIVTSALALHWSVNAKSNELTISHKKLRKSLKEAISVLDFQEKDYERFMQSENSFCSDIRVIILHGGIEEDLRNVVTKRVSNLTVSYIKLINEYGYIATVLPMLGMIGTITGLLQMFAINSGVDDFSEKLASLSVALATTLYATLFVVFVTKPKSRDIESWLISVDHEEEQLILQSKLFLHTLDMNILQSVPPNQINKKEKKSSYFS
jgi:flagellar motor component MotA